MADPADPTAPWRPATAPNLKKDFYKSRRPEFPPDVEQGPVSRVQIEKLKSLADQTQTKAKAPASTNNMEPNGMSKVPTKSATTTAGKAELPKAPPIPPTERIKFMEARLAQHKGIAKDRFQRVSRPTPKREP